MLDSSLSEAKKLAAEDPDHVRGIGTMEVCEWNAHRAFRLNGPTMERTDPAKEYVLERIISGCPTI